MDEREVEKALSHLLEYVDGQRVAEAYLPKHAYRRLFDSYEDAYGFLKDEAFIEHSDFSIGVANRTVSDCKAFLKTNGLSVSGNKPILVDRILSSFSADELLDFSNPGLIYQITPHAYAVLPFLENDINDIRESRATWVEEEKRLRLIRLNALLPKVTRIWRNELEMLHVVQSIFAEDEVIHHYRASWLGSLELDVYAVGANIGFEYQGIQHFEPQPHWGGEAAFVRGRERDAEKARRCADNGTRLIEVRYDEAVTEEVVRQKLGGVWSASL